MRCCTIMDTQEECTIGSRSLLCGWRTTWTVLRSDGWKARRDTTQEVDESPPMRSLFFLYPHSAQRDPYDTMPRSHPTELSFFGNKALCL
jgi:hypothetical protein